MSYGLFRLLRADMTVKRYADVILSISEWENRVYWNRLPGAARVEWLPYYCPEHLLPGRALSLECSVLDEDFEAGSRGVGYEKDKSDAGPPKTTRRNVIACLPTSQKNRKSWDLVSRFVRLADHLSTQHTIHYDFAITGQLDNWELPPSQHVIYTGMLDDLSALYRSTKAVCLLSPLGYGFKTTIGDAIANGCYVLSHPTLARRCPEALQPAIIPVDTSQPNTIDDAMGQLERPFPISNANDALRDINHRLLAECFHIPVSSRG